MTGMKLCSVARSA